MPGERRAGCEAYIRAVDDENEDGVGPCECRHVKVERDDERDPAGNVRDEERLVEAATEPRYAGDEDEDTCDSADETRDVHDARGAERRFEQVEERVEEAAEDGQPAGDSVEEVELVAGESRSNWQAGASLDATYLLVAFTDEREEAILAGEEEDGRKRRHADVAAPPRVALVVEALVEQAKDDDCLVRKTDSDLSPRQAEQRRLGKQHAVVPPPERCADLADGVDA